MRQHITSFYSQEAMGVKTIFCKKCGKEGLQLVLEPDCPGEIEFVIKEKEIDNDKKFD